MLSKSQVSFLKSLQQKKFRRVHQSFLAEGTKTVYEFIQSDYKIDTLYYTTPLPANLLNLSSKKTNFIEISANDMAKVSSLTTPPDCLAVIKIPATVDLLTNNLQNCFTLVIDGVQDPGNLGTIIRTADWFGFKNIICSADTVDAYNPKVVQATMGSLARINIHYAPLEELLPSLSLPVFGALLNGSNIYETNFGNQGLIVLGNEGNGIRPQIQQLVQQAVTIPLFGKAESLNVAVAAAVFCSEIARKTLK